MMAIKAEILFSPNDHLDSIANLMGLFNHSKIPALQKDDYWTMAAKIGLKHISWALQAWFSFTFSKFT